MSTTNLAAISGCFERAVAPIVVEPVWTTGVLKCGIGVMPHAFQIPSNKNARVPPQAPRLDQTKVIDYDFAKYGSSAERKRLLSKWDKEVKALPK